MATAGEELRGSGEDGEEAEEEEPVPQSDAESSEPERERSRSPRPKASVSVLASRHLDQRMMHWKIFENVPMFATACLTI